MVSDLIHLENEMYGTQNDPINMALRRYAGMALTNLTFGDVVNKVPPSKTLCLSLKVMALILLQLLLKQHQIFTMFLFNVSYFKLQRFYIKMSFMLYNTIT